MPRLLIVNFNYPPDYSVGAKRALRVSTRLAKLGWEVEVLTAHPSSFERLDMTLEASDPGIRVARTRAILPLRWARRWRDRVRSRASRETAAGPGAATHAAVPVHAGDPLWRRLLTTPDEYLGWAPLAVVGGLLKVSRPDVILSSAPPFSAHLAAGLLARWRRCALVLDYRDPWTSLRDPAAAQGSLERMERRMESWSLRRADAVVATTPTIEASIGTIASVRTAVIPNACDPDTFSTVEPTPFDHFTIVYAGTFYGSRSARPILEAIRRLRDSGRWPAGGARLRVLGGTGAEVAAAAAALGLSDCVEVEEFLPYREALCRVSGADILLLVVGDTHGGMVPAKLFDYLAAGRFILAIAPPGSEAGAILRETRAGAEFEPGDVEGIASCIADRIERRHEPWPAPVVPARFTVASTTAALDALLRDVIARS